MRTAKIGLTLLLAACSPNTPTSSDKNPPSAGSPSPASDPAGSAEQNAAATPVQVTGAYLVDCANVGENGFGCVAQDAAKRQKVAVQQMQITVVFTDQTQTTPALTAAPATSPWSVYFTLPAAVLSKLSSFQVGITVAGVQQPLQTVNASALPIKPVLTQAMLSTANVMFITSEAYTPGGNGFNGMDDMQANCQRLGAASTFIPDGVKLKWAPLLSIVPVKPADTSPDIVDYIGTISGPVSSTAGRIVQDGALFWGPHLAPVITDENGGYVGGDALVWTGSDATGRQVPGATCNNWGEGGQPTSSDTSAVGLAGNLTTWLDGTTNAPCQSAQHVYCFGQR